MNTNVEGTQTVIVLSQSTNERLNIERSSFLAGTGVARQVGESFSDYQNSDIYCQLRKHLLWLCWSWDESRVASGSLQIYPVLTAIYLLQMSPCVYKFNYVFLHPKEIKAGSVFCNSNSPADSQGNSTHGLCIAFPQQTQWSPELWVPHGTFHNQSVWQNTGSTNQNIQSKHKECIRYWWTSNLVNSMWIWEIFPHELGQLDLSVLR
jgi:hypothetical protein